MAMPTYPQAVADFVAALTSADFETGGHRTVFIPTAQGALSFADYCQLVAVELVALAQQVSIDAASATAGSGTEVTVGQIWTGAAAQYLSIRRAYEANVPINLSYAATVAVDLNTGINFSLTLTGNPTLGNPTNAVAGKSGIIIVNQDATGGRTLAKQANWKVAGGEIILDPSPNAKNVLAYYVESPTSILVTVSEAFG